MTWLQFDFSSTSKTLNLSLLQFIERSESENHATEFKCLVVLHSNTLYNLLDFLSLIYNFVF